MKNLNPDQLPDICKTQLLDDPIHTVWRTVSTSEGIAAWFVTNNFQPVKGHEFHLDMPEPQGKIACKVTHIEPPYRLAYDVGKDWHWTFALKELEDRTELTFIWSGWDASKISEIGLSHTTLHSQLFDGTNVLMKSLARSIRKPPSRFNGTSQPGVIRKRQAQLQVVGMACGNCVRSVEKALEEIGASGQVSLKSGTVTVYYDDSQLSLQSVKDAIEDLGYDIAK